MTNIQTYFPRVKPLNYDALALQLGCQNVGPIVIRGFLGFSLLCASERDAFSSQFTKLKTIAEAVGPRGEGLPLPFETPWVAWVAKGGIRVAPNILASQVSNTAGAHTSLFANEKPDYLSLAFSRFGGMAIAIQKDAATIKISRAVTHPGEPDEDLGQYEFPGLSPALWQIGEIHTSDDASESELVCFYLRVEYPKTIFCRFSGEQFSIERIALADMPSNLSYIIGASREGHRLVLRGRDQYDLDISIYGAADGILSHDSASISIAFVSGRHIQVVDPISLPVERTKLSVSFTVGQYRLVVNTAPAIPAEAGFLSVGFVSGNYF